MIIKIAVAVLVSEVPKFIAVPTQRVPRKPIRAPIVLAATIGVTLHSVVGFREQHSGLMDCRKTRLHSKCLLDRVLTEIARRGQCYG